MRSPAQGVSIPRHALLSRASPDTPSGNYPPATVDCPSDRPVIRNATSISDTESEWLERRRANTVQPLSDFLSRMNIPDFDAANYIDTHRENISALPNIGLAFSGGGWRALQNGGGFMAAADGRTPNATAAGGIGGLLQASTYVAGLSGGGWLVGSIFLNNFTTVVDLRDSDRVWDFENSIFEGPDTRLQVLGTADYLNTIRREVADKRDAGFAISFTDYWGRALSYQLINATDGGPAYTWSSLADDEALMNGDIPLPMIVAIGRAPGTIVISLNSTVFEFNPWEMGSWDPALSAFAPMKYIGSNFTAGDIPDSGVCVAGLDQAGFVMGTSSSLFNTVLTGLNNSGVPDYVNDFLTSIFTEVGDADADIARYNPNPFVNYTDSSIASSDELDLVDGGLDNQNIPLNPLIQPARAVDVIFAVDSSADVNNWPNGSSLVQTYQRALKKDIENGTPFPSIPDTNTFINLGLNNRPTFFGCNSSNITEGTQGIAPLIVYVPNAPYVTRSNVSTFEFKYNNTQRNAIINNGYDVATLANGTLDSEWGTCVACAVLSRSFERTGQDVPARCQQCFDRYCWNGTVDSTPATYFPTFKINEGDLSTKKKSAGSRVSSLGGFAMVVMGLTAVLSL